MEGDVRVAGDQATPGDTQLAVVQASPISGGQGDTLPWPTLDTVISCSSTELNNLGKEPNEPKKEVIEGKGKCAEPGKELDLDEQAEEVMEQVKKMIDQDHTLTEEEKAFIMEHVVKELSQQDKALNDHVNKMEFEEEDETVMEHVKKQLEREDICEEDKKFIMEEIKDLMKKDKAQTEQVIKLCEHTNKAKEEEEPLNIKLKDMEKTLKDNGTELTNGKELDLDEEAKEVMEQVKKMIDQDGTLTEEEKAFIMEHVVKELSQQDKAQNEHVNQMEFEEEDETVMEHVKKQLEREEICEEDKKFIMEEVKDLMKKDKAQTEQVKELCEHNTKVKEEEEPLELNIELKDMEKAPKDNGTELTNGKEELIKENGEVDQVKSLMEIEELTAEENEVIIEPLKELVQKDNAPTNQENEFSDHKTRVEVEKSLVDNGFELEKTELNEQISEEGQEKLPGQENKFIVEPLKDLIQKEKAPTAVEPKAESKVPEKELQKVLVDKETELKDQEEKTLMEHGTELKDMGKALEDNGNNVTKIVPTQPEKTLVETKECMEPKVQLVPVKELQLQDKEPEKAEEDMDYQTYIKDQEKVELTRTNQEDKLMELKTEQKDLKEEPKEQGQELMDHQDNEQHLDQEQHVEGTTEETDGQANEHERMNDTHGESETTVCETQVEDTNQTRYAVHKKLERLREELEKRQHFQDIQTKFMDILRLKMHMIAHRLDGNENNTDMQKMKEQMADKIADLERLKKGTVPKSKGMQETPGAGTEQGHEGKIDQIVSVIAGVQGEVVKEKLRMAEHTIAEQQRQICVLERTAAEFMTMYKEMQKDKEEAQRHREEQDQRILQLQTLAAELMTKMTEMERHSNEAAQRRQECENTTEAKERMAEDNDLRQAEQQLAMVMLDEANILNEEEDGENKEKIKTPCLDLEDMRRDIWVVGDQATPGVTQLSLDQASLTSGGQEDPLPWFTLDAVISCSSTNAEVEIMSMELKRKQQKHMEKEDNEEKEVIEMEKEQTKKVEPADQRKEWTGVGLETNDQREEQGEVEIEVMEEANILGEKEERKNYKVEIKTTLEDIRRDIWVAGHQATPGVTLVSLSQASLTSGGQGDTLPWFTLDKMISWGSTNAEKLTEMERHSNEAAQRGEERGNTTEATESMIEDYDLRQGEQQLAMVMLEEEDGENKEKIKTPYLDLEDMRRDIWVAGDQATPGDTQLSLDQASPTSEGQGDTLPWFTLDTVMIWNEGTELDEETTDKGEEQGTPGVTQLSVGQASPTSGKGDTLPWFTLDTIMSWKSTNAEVEKRSVALETQEVNNVGKQEKKEKQKEQTKLHEVIEKVTKAMEAKGQQDKALAEHKNDDEMTAHRDDEKHQQMCTDGQIPLTGYHQKLIKPMQVARELKNDRKLMSETSTNTLLGWGDPNFLRPEDDGMETATDGERRVDQPESHQGEKKKKKKSVLKWLKKRLGFK
ncbi:golgin subfamily A member 6-like protein 22 [Engraulis encrasicolus]|uniref:golgin subfamily A member 6-like protein 22 n=1 Tax=Engraulis encrasicolus TaxID=184585 RepID=UPI002FCE956A